MITVAIALAVLTAAEPAPQTSPVVQASPVVDDTFPVRGVLAAEAQLRLGPDAGAVLVAAAPAGTLVALAEGRAGRFVRVRLASGTSGFVPTASVDRGAVAEAAWASPAAVAPPRALEDPRLAPDHGRLPRRHDGGLARVELGVGTLSAASGTPTRGGFTSARLRGGSTLLAVTAAQPMREGLLLGGQIWFARAGEATNDGEFGIPLMEGATIDPEGRVTMIGLAPVLVWYARPINLHVSIAPGISIVRVKAQAPLDWFGTPQDDWSPGWGFSVRASAGWELWVSDALAVGPAFSVGLGRNRDSAWGTQTWRSLTWNAGVSATWN